MRADLQGTVLDFVLPVRSQYYSCIELNSSSRLHISGHIVTNQLIDNVDIMNRRNNCVGQVNSVSFCLSKLNASVRYKLFQSYCMSIYGCERWSPTNDRIDDLCIPWRKSLRNTFYRIHSLL